MAEEKDAGAGAGRPAADASPVRPQPPSAAQPQTAPPAGTAPDAAQLADMVNLARDAVAPPVRTGAATTTSHLRPAGRLERFGQIAGVIALAISILLGVLSVSDRFFLARTIEEQALRAELAQLMERMAETNVILIDRGMFNADAGSISQNDLNVINILTSPRQARAVRAAQIAEALDYRVAPAQMIYIAGDLVYFSENERAVAMARKALEHSVSTVEIMSSQAVLAGTLFLPGREQDIAAGRSLFEQAIGNGLSLGGGQQIANLYASATGWIKAETNAGHCAQAFDVVERFRAIIAAHAVDKRLWHGTLNDFVLTLNKGQVPCKVAL